MTNVVVIFVVLRVFQFQITVYKLSDNQLFNCSHGCDAATDVSIIDSA